MSLKGGRLHTSANLLFLTDLFASACRLHMGLFGAPLAEPQQEETLADSN